MKGWGFSGMDTKKPMSRRMFSTVVAGTFLTVGVLEAAVQESRSNGALSDETALILLRHIGYEPTLPNEMKKLKPMLEATLRDLQAIRDFELPNFLEPAFVFHPDR